MARSRNNPILILLIGLSILFVLLAGWVIIRESRMTAALPLLPVNNTTVPAVKPAPRAMDYAPSRAPETTKQMYVRMQQPVVVNKLSPENSTDQKYNMGYEWASGQKLNNSDQCKMLSAEYISGCQAYIEVKHYVHHTDPSMNTPRN
ncbi:hypothetical protein ACF3NA_03610 [Alkanindiges sp. WGS2144]|uniref:hypothetical protein n=1 Tax=Alkanindiges sp. WGS2144 TaxID=3366808 RepID=UPI003752A29E